MNNDQSAAAQLRKDIFLTACAANTAHLASAYSIVEILYVLYMKGIMKYDPQNPDMKDRDRLILSKGHGSLALYNVLCLAGFFDRDALRSFCNPGSEFGGEPVLGGVPGIEASTGSLGHGLSVGVGIAIANKMDAVESRTYVILGDGECQEGTVWEAVMSAAAFKLDNLTVILDNNRLQKMGAVSDIMGIDDWVSRWSSFGWDVAQTDGHNIDELTKVFSDVGEPGKPRLIIAHTVKGKGVSLMENNAAWHWRLPNKREIKTFMSELDITPEEVEYAKSIHNRTV